MVENGHEFALLKLFPADDAEFVAYAQATLTAIGEAAGPRELERHLRECYPAVHVREQEWLGMNGATRPHWYVFRDGRVVASRSGDSPSE